MITLSGFRWIENKGDLLLQVAMVTRMAEVTWSERAPSRKKSSCPVTTISTTWLTIHRCPATRSPSGSSIHWLNLILTWKNIFIIYMNNCVKLRIIHSYPPSHHPTCTTGVVRSKVDVKLLSRLELELLIEVVNVLVDVVADRDRVLVKSYINQWIPGNFQKLHL